MHFIVEYSNLPLQKRERKLQRARLPQPHRKSYPSIEEGPAFCSTIRHIISNMLNIFLNVDNTISDKIIFKQVDEISTNFTLGVFHTFMILLVSAEEKLH